MEHTLQCRVKVDDGLVRRVLQVVRLEARPVSERTSRRVLWDAYLKVVMEGLHYVTPRHAFLAEQIGQRLV